MIESILVLFRVGLPQEGHGPGPIIAARKVALKELNSGDYHPDGLLMIPTESERLSGSWLFLRWLFQSRLT